ncbi:MAG: 16S rRNA (cytosine(967)-C(5))-methyltransferase RsmB [Clostridia bacterium]|nr:16S rRNA (cytosine(967)-C(5))-methyltransferase RsmB [Clostridia bacterium]
MAIHIPREVALKILYEINEKDAYSNIAVNKHLESHSLNPLDKAFVTDMVYGTLKWRLSIDWVIGHFSSVKIKKISPWILNILRMGVYQLLYMEKVPESAAVNESVNLAKRYGHTASSRFVNAVLRSIIKKKDEIHYPDSQKDLEAYLSVKYSHPEWMVKNWVGRFGREFTEKLLQSNNEIPDFSVRVNRIKVTKEELVEKFKEKDIPTENGKYLEEALVIKKPMAITKTDAFILGDFQIQDESSMLVARALDPQKDELVMDVCSAPGGKATHIAELMDNKGTVIARDIHPHKIELIKEAARRLGLQIIRAEVFDAQSVDPDYIKKADRVLVDAPCTGLGIIRRKPDIKWARDIEDKKEITKLQLKILSSASEYVKPGGVLVYSTCTIESEENEEIVEAFLKTKGEFELCDMEDVLPIPLKKNNQPRGMVQLYPHIDGMDGFFIAKMKRRK